MNKIVKNILYVPLLFILVIIDYLIKVKVKTSMSVGDSKEIVKNLFSITYIQNRGAAFGILQNQKIIFIIVSIIVICVLMNMFIKSENIFFKTSIIMIVSGAIGNILDRINYGFVVDMFDFHGIWSYIFNFADICVVVGVSILCISILREK